MATGDVKKVLIVVSLFLVVFLAFFFFFWHPEFAKLRRYQGDLSEKEAELIQLERDAKDWPDTITRELLKQYEDKLEQFWSLIPSQEEIAMLLDEIQSRARTVNLEILEIRSLSSALTTRTARAAVGVTQPEAGKKPRYIRVPYKISLGGSYFGLIKFLRSLEDSERLVTITDISIYARRGKHPVDADIQFDIFYSKEGVEAS